MILCFFYDDRIASGGQQQIAVLHTIRFLAEDLWLNGVCLRPETQLLLLQASISALLSDDLVLCLTAAEAVFALLGCVHDSLSKELLQSQLVEALLVAHLAVDESLHNNVAYAGVAWLLECCRYDIIIGSWSSDWVRERYKYKFIYVYLFYVCIPAQKEVVNMCIDIYLHFLFGRHAECNRLAHKTFPTSQFSSTSTQVLSVSGRVCLHFTLLGKACHGISRYFGRAHGTDLTDLTENSQQ